MNLWENAVITDEGLALQARIINEHSLKISRAVTGAGFVPLVNLRQQTEVSTPKQEIRLLQPIVKGDNITIPLILENTELKEGYELWQVGFYVEDPEGGEVLYCLAQANKEKMIPSAAESPGFSITWNFNLKSSNTVPFEVTIDYAGMVTVEQYEIHTKAIEKLNGQVGNLDSLKTSEKNNLTGAVNEVKDQAGQISSNLTKYLPLSGGRVTGDLYLNKGFNVLSSGDGGGAAGYLLMAEIRLSGNYVNSPIKLEICRRGDIFSTDVYIQFSNDSGTDPNVYSFYYNNNGMKNMNMYLYRNSAGVWYFYVGKSESYDHVAILDVKTNLSYMSSVQIKTNGKYVASVPSGSLKATNYGDSGWVDCGMGNGISAYGSTSNRPQVRKMGKIVHIRGIVTNSTTWQSHDSFITIPSGFRPSMNEYYVMQGSGSNRYLFTAAASGKCMAQKYSNNTTANNTVPAGSWLNLHCSWFVE
ncbi:hypothetical protein [Anaerostipes sp.]|uniref:hypothetical protein n=1 Tax=Anaerostipes sp. TaxID=1872530 RepID=UPI0025BD2E02|nr:hypothetical protein [Anaerostipes sp.]MBS7009360.1 hypothetical protein [Anaerostipes sp.]